MENEYGICAECNQPLTDHQVQFDRRIERMEYMPIEPSDFQAIVIVLYCDDIGCYCSKDCADLGVQKELRDRGINKTDTSIGPVTSCAKCGAIVDMIQPHVHYEQMEVTVNKAPAQTTITVLHSEGLGDVCISCDPDGTRLATIHQAEPIAQTPVRS